MTTGQTLVCLAFFLAFTGLGLYCGWRMRGSWDQMEARRVEALGDDQTEVAQLRRELTDARRMVGTIVFQCGGTFVVTSRSMTEVDYDAVVLGTNNRDGDLVLRYLPKALRRG